MQPLANRTMKCCGSGNRGSGLLLRRERAKSEFGGEYMKIVQVANDEEKKAVAKNILEELPEWFGIPEAREE